MSISDIIKRLRSLISRAKAGPSTQDLTKRLVFSVTKKRTFPSWEQWKHLPRSLSTPERQISLVALFVLTVSFIFLAGQFIVTHQQLVPARGGEYTEALVGSPQFVNPLYALRSDVDQDLTRLIYSGLVTFNGEAIVPDLAESYDVSDDGLTYTFVVRKDVHWHDGKSVTANDVINTFAMIQNPEYLSPLLTVFKDVDVALIDERTVQFTLSKTSPTFLSHLSVGILPSHIWDLIPPKNAILAEYNLRPVGSGPYKFEKFSKDNLGNIYSYTLVRNGDYQPSPANIEHLIFRFYPDTFLAAEALRKKNVEGVSYLQAQDAKDLASDKDINLIRPSIPQYTALFFNEIHAPNLKTDKVREALTAAIDRHELVNQIFGSNGATVINSPILQGMPGYDEALAEPSFDLERAKTLLDEAQLTATEEAPVRFTLTLTTIDSPEFVEVAEFIKASWRLIGVETSIKKVNYDILQSDVLKEKSYDVLLSGALLSDGDPDPYAFWHSSQVDFPGLNLSLYSNRKVDALIEDGREEIDPTKRAEIYHDFQELLLADQPAVFLYQPTYAYALSSKINGVEIDSVNEASDRFANITSWYIKTRHVLRWD